MNLQGIFLFVRVLIFLFYFAKQIYLMKTNFIVSTFGGQYFYLISVWNICPEGKKYFPSTSLLNKNLSCDDSWNLIFLLNLSFILYVS